MRLTKLAASLALFASLGAFFVSSASATATTTAANWYTASSGSSPLSGSLPVTAALKSGTGVKIAFGVGGSHFTFTASGVGCVSCSFSNSSTGGSGTGKLQFTGVTLDTPAGVTCGSVPPTVTSQELNFNSDYMEGETWLIRIAPVTGEKFMLFSPTCTPPIGTVTFAGTLFGKAANKTGVLAASQEITFTPAINSTAGGIFKVGTEVANFEATTLLGAAEAFGAK